MKVFTDSENNGIDIINEEGQGLYLWESSINRWVVSVEELHEGSNNFAGTKDEIIKILEQAIYHIKNNAR